MLLLLLCSCCRLPHSQLRSTSSTPRFSRACVHVCSMLIDIKSPKKFACTYLHTNINSDGSTFVLCVVVVVAVVVGNGGGGDVVDGVVVVVVGKVVVFVVVVLVAVVACCVCGCKLNKYKGRQRYESNRGCWCCFC